MFPKKNIFLILMVAVVLFSCSSNQKKVNERSYKIRYVNIRAIFNTLVASNFEAQRLQKERKILLSKLDDLKAKNKNVAKVLKIKKRLNDITIKEEKIKKILLENIKLSIGNVAKKFDVDFVYSLGEGLIYSKSKYDITKYVLKDVLSLIERSAPVNR